MSPFNITYLLGAGASSPTLPIASGLTAEIARYLSVLRRHESEFLLDNSQFDENLHLLGTKQSSVFSQFCAEPTPGGILSSIFM